MKTPRTITNIESDPWCHCLDTEGVVYLHSRCSKAKTLNVRYIGTNDILNVSVSKHELYYTWVV